MFTNDSPLVASMAYEKRAHKSQCALCNLYFERKSIHYKIPNYRIIELRKSWNYAQDGKRYDSASFRYFSVRVCLFCAQFFSDGETSIINDDIEKSMMPDIEPALILSSAPLDRQNIAIGCTAYQSSTVDGCAASIALQDSITSTTDLVHDYKAIKYAKTRREESAFWEVDLGSVRNVRAIKLSVSAGHARNVKLSIFILNEPLGTRKIPLSQLQGMTVVSQRFRLIDYSPATKPVDADKLLLCTFQDVFWTLPSTGTGQAVRVVLHGQHSLQIYSFAAFQGDGVLDGDSAHPAAALPPKTPANRASSPSKSLFSAANNFSWSLETTTPKVKEQVLQLQSKADTLYEVKEDWHNRVIQSVAYFRPEDLRAMLSCVFNHILLDAHPATELVITEDNCLEDAALTSTEPRVPLAQLLVTIKTIFRWIHLRDSSKIGVLRCLYSSHQFQDESFRLRDMMNSLGKAFHVVQTYAHVEQTKTEMLARKNEGVEGISSASCCWPQLILLLELALSKKFHAIPREVFFVPLRFGKTLLSDKDFTEDITNELTGDDHSHLPPIVSNKSARSSRPGTKLSTVSKGPSKSMGKMNIKVLRQAPSLAYLEAAAAREVKPKGFQRYCGLCGYQFPKASCTNVVTFKHVVALRQHWDPALISDEVMALEQSSCFLNKVFVCAFCAQFFEPTIREKIIAEGLTKVKYIVSALFVAYHGVSFVVAGTESSCEG